MNKWKCAFLVDLRFIYFFSSSFDADAVAHKAYHLDAAVWFHEQSTSCEAQFKQAYFSFAHRKRKFFLYFSLLSCRSIHFISFIHGIHDMLYWMHWRWMHTQIEPATILIFFYFFFRSSIYLRCLFMHTSSQLRIARKWSHIAPQCISFSNECSIMHRYRSSSMLCIFVLPFVCISLIVAYNSHMRISRGVPRTTEYVQNMHNALMSDHWSQSIEIFIASWLPFLSMRKLQVQRPSPSTSLERNDFLSAASSSIVCIQLLRSVRRCTCQNQFNVLCHYRNRGCRR